MLKKLLVPLLILVLVLGPNAGFSETESMDSESSEEESQAPRGDLPNWKQVFVDDFDEYGNVSIGSFSACHHHVDDAKKAFCLGLKEPLRSRWWAYPKGWPDRAQKHQYPVGGQYNPDETVSIEDGKLRIDLKNDGTKNHVAALVLKAAVGQTYGRYAIRFKADPTPGYKFSTLLWPVKEGSCPGCEIVFPEMELDKEISGYVRHKLDSKDDPKMEDQYQTDQLADEWHTAVIEWSPHGVEFFLDGEKVTGTSSEGEEIDESTENIPDQPMTWVIQSESAFDDRAKNDEVVADSDSTATILIDWVAAYTYTGEEDGQDEEPEEPEQEVEDDEQNEASEDQESDDQPAQEKQAESNEQDEKESKPEAEEQSESEQEPNDEEDQQNVESEEPDLETQEQVLDSEDVANEKKVNPKINIHSMVYDDGKVGVSINLENVKHPKGTWLLTFDREKPKHFNNMGASVYHVFEPNDPTRDEVPLTVEFKGEDEDGVPIHTKTTKMIQVKDLADKLEEKIVNNQYAASKKIGGKLPVTDTAYQQGIGAGLLIILCGVMGLWAVRRRNSDFHGS